MTMIKKLTALLCCILTSQALFSQVTFAVDENLPEPIEELGNWHDGRYVITNLFDSYLFDFQHPDKEERKFSKVWGIVKYQYSTDSLLVSSLDPLYKCFVQAFATHRPLVLSPDDIWLCVSQQFARYVTLNQSKLRKHFVNFSDKESLSVTVDKPLRDPSLDWNEVTRQFSQQIKANTKGNIADLFTADFSTTCSTGRTVSQMTLMQAMQSYFDYEIIVVVCGIPSITLEGQPADWEHLLRKVQRLKKYGMKRWLKSLEPILREFIKASEGQPDIAFWKDIVMKYRPTELISSRSCGSNKPTPTELDGWFTKLFYYDSKGKKANHYYADSDMLNEIGTVPCTFNVQSADGKTLSSQQLTFYSGFIGYSVDPATQALKPQIG